MPLTGKYLKYSPEITLEIFTLVWDKLIKSGYKCDYYKDKLYEMFQFKPMRYLRLSKNSTFDFYAYSTTNTETETTVQEILGYDPFMKENYIYGIDPFIGDDFVLPEKWCIKVTNESFDKVKKWTKREYNISIGSYAFANNFYRYHMHGSLDSGDIEITFDQFKKYVLKESIETPKETNPEYVECINVATCNTRVGEIFKCRHSNGYFEWEYNNKSRISYNSWDGWSYVWGHEIPQKYFKPSTKEAFDAQNKPKSIGLNKFPTEGHCKTDSIELRKYLTKRPNTKISREPKWIEGKSIGVGWNEFSHWVISEKSSKPEYSLDQLSKFLDYSEEKPKQPLKQVVHCTTQEEWDFATEKLGYKWRERSRWDIHKDNTCINLKELGFGTAKVAYEKYQILSFQEWCDLNGYKIETNIDLTGRYLKALVDGPQSTIFKKGDIVEILRKESKNTYSIGESLAKSWTYTTNNATANQWELLPENYKMENEVKFEVEDWVIVLESDSYYDNSEKCPQKINSINDGGSLKYSLLFRDGHTNSYNKIRHATPEEINNHLISIGQIPAEPICTNTNSNRHDGCGEKYGCIQNCDECDYYQTPAGEPLNTGIEPNKDGSYSCISVNREGNPQCTFNSIKINGQEILKSKMILSIDDEELPMVNIIKTNTIKQLLNND